MPELTETPIRRSRASERTATGLIWIAALGIAAAFAWLLGDVIFHGLSRISWEFLTADPSDAGRSGGIGPIIISTFWILVICLVASLPLGLGTAAWLAEYTSSERRTGRFVRSSLDVLAGVPSIVFGLFGNALFCIWMGLGFSILSGGLTLACMVLPIFIRIAEEGFRSVPDEYRHAAASLGMSRTTTLWKVILPSATPGIVAGLVLGIGRALAETAALIFTSGYVDRRPSSLLDSGRALSVHIYDLSMNVPGGEPAAYGTAVVLIALLVVINAMAVFLGRKIIHRSRAA